MTGVYTGLQAGTTYCLVHLCCPFIECGRAMLSRMCQKVCRFSVLCNIYTASSPCPLDDGTSCYQIKSESVEHRKGAF